MQQLMSLYPSANIKDIKDYPYSPPEYKGITYYRSQVTISVPGQQDLLGDSVKYFMNKQISIEMAIKHILFQIQPQQGNQGTYNSII